MLGDLLIGILGTAATETTAADCCWLNAPARTFAYSIAHKLANVTAGCMIFPPSTHLSSKILLCLVSDLGASEVPEIFTGFTVPDMLDQMSVQYTGLICHPPATGHY